MAAYTSTKSGAWNDPTTWSPSGYPQDGDTATINHDVYIDSNVTVGTGATGETVYAITINSGGTLRWANPPSGNWQLTLKGGILINLGGKFQIGTATTPLSSSYTATVYFSTSNTSAQWRIYALNGELDIHGAPAYHMASVDMWRAKLASDVSPGSNVTFTVDRAVDWQVGDVISFGVGASKADFSGTTHKPERVTITGKTNSTTYQATFAYNHRIGDHVAHHTRNVVIKGNESIDSVGFAIRGEHTGGQGDTTGLRVRLSWASFVHGGWGSSRATIFVSTSSTGRTIAWPADFVYIRNCVLDEGSYFASVPRGYGSDFDFSSVALTTPEILRNVIFYRYGYAVRFYSPGCFKISGLVLVGHGVDGITLLSDPVQGTIFVRSWWASYFDYSLGGSYYLLQAYVDVDDFEFFAIPILINVTTRNAYYTPLRLSNGKLYHSRTSVQFGLSGYVVRFSGVEFYDISEFMGSSNTTLHLSGCTFDKVSPTGTSRGAIAAYGYARISNCSFGTSVRNNYLNVFIDSGGSTRRVVAEYCNFREPTNWSSAVGSSLYYTKTFVFSVFQCSADWRYRMANLKQRSSIELAYCNVRDASNADQIALDYGSGISRLFSGHSSSEVIQENTIKIDGTIGIKALPFSPGGSSFINYHRPILIPVTAGQTVTVKVSVRKTSDGYILPFVWLHGCGISKTAYATSGLYNTWEELTLTATALYSGMCFLYFNMGSNKKTTAASNHDDLVFGPNAAPTWWVPTVYFDKLFVEVS